MSQTFGTVHQCARCICARQKRFRWRGNATRPHATCCGAKRRDALPVCFVTCTALFADMHRRPLPAVSDRPNTRPEVIGYEELPTWVPGDILCASDDLGWKGVAQRSYRYLGQDVEIPPLDCHMVVQYEDGLTPMDRQFDGRWTRTSCGAGQFSLLSHKADSHWHWTQGVVVSHIYLADDMLTRLASDMLQRPVSEVKLHDVLSGADTTVQTLCRELRCEAQAASSGSALYAEAVSLQLGVHLLRHYASVELCTDAPVPRLSSAQLERLRAYVDAHLSGPLSLQDMASALGMGPWTLNRRLRRTMGISAYKYLMDQRVDKARLLLQSSELAITDCP